MYRAVWQISGGPVSRAYAEGFLKHGVALSDQVMRTVLEAPEQRWTLRPGRHVLQSTIPMGDPAKEYVVRVIVDVDRNPNEVVTAYRTSKVDKYWRREP